MTGRTPTPRAAAIAEEEDYGPYRCSYRVNRAYDRRMRVALLLLLVVPFPFLKMAYDASPWGDSAIGTSTVGMLVSGITGVIFLGLALFLAVPLLAGLFLRKGAQVHVYEQGAIAERSRGHLYAWPYRRATARYVCWRESNDGQWRDRLQLWVTFHRDGETICFDGLHPKDREVLAPIAREFGIRDQPEQIDGIYRNTAPTPF
ncbi:hypothetical protein M1247_20955 [Mycobacterium sp. 21AC1]|uniref:hypothetical protein n=1 Tax=[Mycobacterium] appelbergii TaxID=2939269 RepID=UPI0029394040|nr:hypothetical protein [Mycobacterium sp. 21AC1]MDV3127407.1 hypothetical protein [Mycobacterium sp. 21AC1]